MFRKPQPLQLVEKVRQYTSNLYGSTPPICIAVLSWLLCLEERETLQFTSHLYCSTPPICTAVRPPFVRQYFWKNTGGWGHRNVSEKCWTLPTPSLSGIIIRLWLLLTIVQPVGPRFSKTRYVGGLGGRNLAWLDRLCLFSSKSGKDARSFFFLFVHVVGRRKLLPFMSRSPEGPPPPWKQFTTVPHPKINLETASRASLFCGPPPES